MKTKLFFALSLFSSVALTSCSGDSSDDFEDSNGNVAHKYITNITTVPSGGSGDTRVFNVIYNNEGKVVQTTEGAESSTFYYQGGNLDHISGHNDVLAVTDMLASPYEAYEYGRVLQYDNNGNPIKVQLFKRDYYGDIIEEFEGEITYENKPNPFFFTLEAAGLIDVLDDMDLNFSLVPQSEELVKAKTLLPVNNPKKVVVKNLQGQIQRTVVATYQYDSDNYPTSALVVDSSAEYGVYTNTVMYTYR